jgi:hypothetical protein
LEIDYRPEAETPYGLVQSVSGHLTAAVELARLHDSQALGVVVFPAKIPEGDSHQNGEHEDGKAPLDPKLHRFALPPHLWSDISAREMKRNLPAAANCAASAQKTQERSQWSWSDVEN